MDDERKFKAIGILLVLVALNAMCGQQMVALGMCIIIAAVIISKK